MTASAKLHRCRNPTDWLCPCGRVARELRRAGVGYEEVRHPWRKRDRDEVLDVSGQAVLPVLEWADGDAICDSVRIVEHLTSARAGAPANGGRPKPVPRAGAPANGGRPKPVAAKRGT